MTAPYASELDRLYAEIEQMARAEGVEALCPRPENRRQEDRCWIVEGSLGRFIQYYMERGQTSVICEGDYETMLFEVMRTAAQSIAVHQEWQARGDGPYSRRKWFGIQRQVMARMRPEWDARIVAYQAAVLAKHPFPADDE